MKLHCKTGVFALALSLVASTAIAVSQDGKFTDTVRVAVFNIPDSDFVDHTFGQVLEKTGYTVEYVKIDYTAHFTALEFGDVDVSPAVWETSKVLIDKAVESGSVASAGSVGVTLLYGSGSDRRRGEGAEMSDEFPISMRFRVPVDTPIDLGEAEITSEVDTSGWFTDGEEDSGSEDTDDSTFEEPE